MDGSVVFVRRCQGDPHLMWFPGPTRLSNPNCMLISTAVFAQLTAEGPYTLQWSDISHSKLPFSWASGPHLIHDSLGSPESTSQMASQEFRFGRPYDSDKLTNHATPSVAIGCI